MNLDGKMYDRQTLSHIELLFQLKTDGSLRGQGNKAKASKVRTHLDSAVYVSIYTILWFISSNIIYMHTYFYNGVHIMALYCTNNVLALYMVTWTLRFDQKEQPT